LSLPFSINPALGRLPVYQPGRPIEEVARELNLPPADIIKLASNENPLGPSRAALRAMREILAKVNLYPDGPAFYLKQKLAAKLDLAPANLILGNGSNEIIEFLGHALLGTSKVPTPTSKVEGVPPSPQPSPSEPDWPSGEGEESNGISGSRSVPEVVVSQYCFAVYPIVTALFGANLVVVPAKKYGHDLDGMLAAITPNTRIVFVANPNNPTGTVVAREDLERFVNAVPENVVVALDEAYIEFLDGAPDFLPEIRAGRKPNLLLMRTFSKIYGLAGLRVGYGMGHPEFIAELEKVRQPFNLNAIAQAGALAALDDSAHAEKTRRVTGRGLKFYASTFRKLKLEFIPSSANFILVRVGDGQRVFNELQKLGVIVRPMGGYQLPEWIRISIGTTRENKRCIEGLQKVLGEREG
jgi:histidinol-phosphate aminotransferase